MTNGLTLDDLRSKMQAMTDDEKQKTLTLLARIGVDLTKPNADLTGTGVAAFIFQNKSYQADSHKDVFVKLTQLLVRQHPDKKEAVFSIQGRSKKYFSRNESDFKHGYERIIGTDIFVDTNENAQALNRRCQRLLQVFGVAPTALTIISC